MIYHFVHMQEWKMAKQLNQHEPQSLAEDGFIHCCTQSQIAELASRLYKGQSDLLLLELNENVLSSTVVYEDLYGSHQDYPHLYGPLNLNAVNQIFRVQSVATGEVDLMPLTPTQEE